MKRPMLGGSHKVLYLNHTGKPGGAEFALCRMLGAIDRNRVNPIVVFGDDGHAVDLMKEVNVEARVIPLIGDIRDMRKDTFGPKALLNVKRAAMLVAYAARIAAFARENGVQLIHTNTIKAHIYGALAGHLTGLPVVWHVRDYVNETYFPSAAVKVVRFLARHAPRHVIGVSQSVMEQLALNDGGRRSTVVLDGLSDEELGSGMNGSEPSSARKTARIGIVGRLARWKGQHVFLEAAARVIKAGYDVSFVIVGAALFGEEAYEAELRQQVSALGLQSRVEFLGFTRDVPTVLRSFDILVHASTTEEPFGQVIVEGMAVGKPVIATRGGGVPEIVTHGVTGVLTAMGDPEELARQVIFLLLNPVTAARLGQAGFEHVRRNFRASGGARKVEGVYESLLESEPIDFVENEEELV